MKAIHKGLTGAGLVICCGMLTNFEGLNLVTKPDPVGIPTRCFGDTGPEVRNGQRYTIDECKGFLKQRAQDVSEQVQECVIVQLTQNQHIAFTSFAYNVGVRKFCNSTINDKLAMLDFNGACHQLRRWIYANGRVLPGLVKRRNDEEALCLKPD